MQSMTAFPAWPDLSRRSARPELMDDPERDEATLCSTLDSFRGVNRFISRTRRLLKRTIIHDLTRRKAASVSLLDIGAGGCDEGRWFVKECQKLGVDCTVYCLDADPRAVRYARDACRSEPSITIIEANALNLADLNLSVDYIFSNHFLHHLDNAAIPVVLRLIGEHARRGFVLQDLHRHPVWYVGFIVIAALLWRRGWTFSDGLSSIARGFTRAELAGFCGKTGVDCRVARSAPGHWCLTNLPA